MDQAQQMAAMLVGATLRGTYRLDRLIGAGGMGAVFRASHTRLSRKFAVKILYRNVAGSREAVNRFRREAEICGQLGHPNIVEVIDFDFTLDGVPYFVMELLEGENLADRIDRGVRMPPMYVARVLEQACAGLDAAHRRGVIHRDLKPQNIFLCQSEGEVVKLLDFGISKVLGSRSMLTDENSVVGTPYYMAPEQAKGHAVDVTPQADIFSMGVIVFHMLSGTAPFDGESIPSVLYKIVHEPPPSLCERVEGLPREVEEAVVKALAKKPEGRWASGRDFAGAVLTALGDKLRPHSSQPVPILPEQAFDGTAEKEAATAHLAETRPGTVTEPPPLDDLPYEDTGAFAESEEEQPRPDDTALESVPIPPEVLPPAFLTLEEEPTIPRDSKGLTPSFTGQVQLRRGWPAGSWLVGLLVVVAAAAITLAVMRPGGDKNASTQQRRPDARVETPEQMLVRARHLADNGEFVAALDLVARVQLTVRDPETIDKAGALERDLRVDSHMRLAQQAADAKRWHGASYHLEKVLLLRPDHAGANGLMARVRHEITGAPSEPGTPPAQKAPAAKKPAKRVPHGELHVLAEPNAMVYLGDTFLGATPINGLPIPTGRHVVTVKRKGCKTHSETFTLRNRQKKAIEVKMIAVPKEAPSTPPRPAVKKTHPAPRPPPRTPTPRPPPGPVVVPEMRLPRRVVVMVRKPDGTRTIQLRAVCVAIERVVTKATGRSAAGLTRSLQNVISSEASAGQKVTVLPRVLGRVIAVGLLGNQSRSAIRAKVLASYRAGRLTE